MIQENLKKLGLNSKEIQIYLTIIESVKINAAQISRKTGINRTTVYSSLDKLLNKGFIVEDKAGSSKYFIANGRTELEEVYRREVQKIQDKKEVFQELITEIESIPKSKSYSIPRIRFYDDIHLDDALYNQANKWIESVVTNKQENLWGFIDPSWTENFKDWIQYYWKQSPEGTGANFLTNDKNNTNGLRVRRKFKLIDKDKHNFTANQVVLGDYVIFVVTDSKPRYMIEIHDKVMAHNMREMFKLLWEKI